MRTYLFTTKQNTLVVEVETDAISNTQDKSTIHDVNVLKGDFSKLQSNGFNINTIDFQKGITILSSDRHKLIITKEKGTNSTKYELFLLDGTFIRASHNYYRDIRSYLGL